MGGYAGAKYLLGAIALTTLLCTCVYRPQTYAGQENGITYERFRPDSVNRPAAYEFAPTRKYVAENYYPDTNNLALLPIKYVRLNVHLMNTADTLYRLHGEAGAEYVRRVIGGCNELLRESPDLSLTPPGMDVSSPPRRVRVEIAKDPITGKDAIYDHFDEIHYDYLHKGKHVNRASRAAVNKYKVREEEEINIFVMGPPRDSLLSKTFKPPSRSGIYVGSAIKVTGWMARERPTWEHRFVLTHEIMHALGLSHAWLRNDGCDDTPVHKNDCWDRNSKPHCDTMLSNNLMDYSGHQLALTPCQIGRFQSRMAAIGSKQRGFLRPDWCQYTPDESVEITYNVTLDGARDFAADIYVQNGATLRINNRVHLAKGAGIFVDPGATLELGPAAVIHNNCGESWQGIFRGSSAAGEPGTIITDPNATLLNTAP